MLHRNMGPVMSLLLSLEDLLGELRHARRQEDLGRLALVTYCEVRRWARVARQQPLASLTEAMVTEGPARSRDEFLSQIDHLIFEMEGLRQAWLRSGMPTLPGRTSSQQVSTASP